MVLCVRRNRTPRGAMLPEAARSRESLSFYRSGDRHCQRAAETTQAGQRVFGFRSFGGSA
jgi:hypothetical protein